MRTNYVLIDYENVQPRNIAALAADHFRVMVFVGSQQKSVPVDLAMALQALGERGEYIQVSGTGRDALDFHIAFHIGRLSEISPDAFFHVISKDAGFDPLITHLKSRNIFSRRSASIDAIPVLRSLSDASKDDQVGAVIEKLRGMPKSRPQKDRTLRSMISAWFGQKLDTASLDRIVAGLQRAEALRIEDGKIKYSLPNP